MKHAWKKLLAAAVLPCLLAGCGALGGPESEVPSMDHLLGLTQEQRLEDYDYLVQTLGDSYLCMGVRDRDNPEDPSAAIFQAYREMIQESDSDEVFYSAVYSTLFRLGTYGHLWIVEPDMYRAYCEAYEDGGIQDREHWREVLTDPVTVRGYERLQTLLDAYGEEDGTVNSADSEEPAANLHTLLLPGGDVGYVKIDSFPAEYEDSYATDRAALTDFYRQAADCTDLIIDLTDNSGGSEVYWQQLLAAPLTDRPLSCTNYALLAESGCTHISGYLLKIEPNTVFGKRPPEALPGDDAAADFYLAAVEKLAALGYAQYEISNFARPGFESRHNRIYWDCGDYLGLGPAAHSCMGGKRFATPAGTAAFLAAPAVYEPQGECTAEDYIMLQLRLSRGLSLSALRARYGVSFSSEKLRFLQTLAEHGLAVFDGSVLRLTPRGMLVQNSILCELV